MNRNMSNVYNIHTHNMKAMLCVSTFVIAERELQYSTAMN